VGFLPRHYVKNWEDYEGRLAQVVEFYKDSDSPEKRKKNYRNSGCCKAVLIDTKFGDDADDNIFSPSKWRQFNENASKQGEEDLKKKGLVVKKEGEEKNDFESALGGDDDNNDDDNDAWLTPESQKKDKRKAADHEGHCVEEGEKDVMEKEKKKKAKM
jgi:tRNA G10  N-methylase Trm11